MQEGCRASPEEIHFKSSVQNDDDDDAVPTGLHARGIYGGLLVSQGLYAAFLSFQISDARGSRSEEAEADPILDPTLSEYAFLCNSCHAYFLSPGRATLPVLYSVATLRRGKQH